MKLVEKLGKEILFIDGAMGSMMQALGAKPGENTGLWNLHRAEDVKGIHRQYLQAGANIILANTFGADRLKLSGTEYSVEEVVAAGVKNAKEEAVEYFEANGGTYVAVDVAPTGKLLKPLGDLSFEDAYEIFKEIVVAGEKAGADLVQVETMSDTLELKAAVLAAKENTELPVIATVTFDEKGKMLTGGNVPAVVALLEGLGVDALGVNCGLGPVQLQQVVADLLKYASVPVAVSPNAGLPRQEGGKTVYDIDALQFAEKMKEFVKAGAWIAGGCCGTTPEHIKCLVEACRGVEPAPLSEKNVALVSSYTHAVDLMQGPVVIGERINPTGKARFKQALRDKDLDYILNEGFVQEEKGAEILDINVGLPEIDEASMIVDVVREVQSVINLPLQIDTSNIEAMEKALRCYNGKAMINSVNGKAESMEAVFPLVKKYGGVVVGLTLDEEGIPETAEGRLAVAEKIVKTAESYGIKRKDIVIDVLCMTISSDKNSAMTTLKALRLVKEKLGVRTILGVSNVSFGLPRRDIINTNFYTMALQAGLDCGIINPNADGMMQAHHAYKALAGLDDNCEGFIEKYAGTVAPAAGTSASAMSVAGTAGGNAPKSGAVVVGIAACGNEIGSAEVKTAGDLEHAIMKGLKEQAGHIAAQLVKTVEPLELINTQLVPALDKVGKGFEQGTVFLPQLLMSAEAAKAAFESVRAEMDSQGKSGEGKKGKVIIATVKGDIHDIGKNIVKVLLENYDFEVIDLGKDVEPEVIADKAVEMDVKLVGLSALMTTTVGAMEETIKLLAEKKPDCKVMAGGAVLTQQYCEMIDADKYVKDAMASVYYAQDVL